MAHIFEISKPDSFISFEGKKYKLKDPGFGDKVLFQEKNDKMEEELKTATPADAMKRRRANHKEMVKKYLPDMSDEALDALSDSEFAMFQEAILKAIAMKFGAEVKIKEGDAAGK